MRRDRSQQGFSLLEVMIAFGLLAFGVLGVTAAQIAGMKSTRNSRQSSEAMYLAQRQLELFQSMPGQALTDLIADPSYPNDPNNPLDPTPGDGDSTTYNRSYTLTPNSPETGIFSIAVQVSYTDAQGITRTTSLSGLKADL